MPNKSVFTLDSVIVFYILFCGLTITSYSQTTSSLVYLNGGSLTYTSFAMKGQSNAVNTIPDYSYAGYKGGGVALPNIPVMQTVNPGPGDDGAAIQNAIDAVEALTPDANGFRGAVLLTAGSYEVAGQLFIEASGVVLRGEGQGTNGTVIHANQTTKADFLFIQGTGSGITIDSTSTERISTAYVPVGTMSFDLNDASGFSVGDTVAVTRTPNQDWINELGMGQTALCGSTNPPNCVGWTTTAYTIHHERIITAISGNTITINIPVVDVMETQYGGGEVSKASIPGRIENCGVENLRIESYYASNTDENHTWSAIRLKRTVNSWVTKVTGQYMGYGTIIIGNESNFNTIEECASIDHKSQITGGRRYSFTIKDGVGNLFQRCYTREGRHDFETGSRVTGPNVFLDCYSANTHSDIGPHHRWSTGILFDNIRGGQIRVHNRGSSGTGHGWVGGQIMFWNLLSYKSDIKVSSPTGSRNWGIGCTGGTQNGDGYWEHWNSNVTPRSLYLQQLEDRLGTQAVDNIVIDEQKTGDIYNMLSSWAGNGELVPPPTNDSTLSPIADAYVRGGTYANDNFGTATSLIVKENAGTADNDRQSFLKFDVSGLAGNVSNAKIRLRVSNDDIGASHSLHLVADDSWTETGITWNNQPSAGSLIETSVVPLIGEWIEFDVTSEVNSELGGDGTLSVRLSESTVGYFINYRSREYATNSDQPELVYELAPPSTSSLDASEDAYVQGGTSANNNYGNNTILVVKNNSSDSYKRESYLKFDLSSLSGTLTEAKVRVKVQNDDGSGVTHALKFVSNDSWAESSITWNNKPSTGSTLASGMVPTVIGDWLEFDVLTQAQTELDGDGTLSLVLVETTNNHYVGYHSSETANEDDRPQLVYATASNPIVNLALNQPVTVSAEQTGNPGSNAVDGNTGSRWSASGYSQWLEVDLGAIKQISKTEVVCYNDRAYEFVVESKTTSGGTYTQIVDRSSNTQQGTIANPITDTFTETDAKYVRITVSGAAVYTGSWVSLLEFRVFGEDTSPRLGRPNRLDENAIESNLFVYPNPVTNNKATFEFALKESSPVSLNVYNMKGQLVKEVKRELNEGNHQVQLDLNVKSGIFFYVIRTKEFIKNGKLIIANN